MDIHGRFFGTGVGVIKDLTYTTPITKTIYVQNHTFAPVKIDKTLAINVMPISSVWLYSYTTGNPPVIVTMEIIYTLTGILGHPTTAKTVNFRRAFLHNEFVCNPDGVIMEAVLNISGYAKEDVKLTISSVNIDYSYANFVYEYNVNSSVASGYIAIYPMSEAGVE